MSDCTNGGRRAYNAPTHSPAEDRLEITIHFHGEYNQHPIVLNRLDREVDYVTVDGQRFERVRECELNPVARHVDDVACLGFECSLCHMAIYTPGEGLVAAFHGFDFCPLCGAKVKVGA